MLPVLVVEVLVLYFAWQHLVAPLAVYHAHRSHCHPVLPPVAVDAYAAELGPAALHMHRQLLALGYSPSVAANLSASSSSIRFAVYARPDDPMTASLMVARSALGEKLMLEFTLVSDRGVRMGILNSAQPLVYPPWERKIVYRVLGVPDAAQLHAALVRLQARHPAFHAVIQPAGDELARIVEYMEDEVRYLVGCGYMKRDCDRRGRGLTLRGAYRMSWLLSWPWKAISNLRARRLGRQLLAEAA